MPPTLDSHIEVTPGVCGGRPRLAGRRITVEHIAIWHERLGLSVDEIAAEHDLTLADVYAALAYYHANREVIDQRMREGQALVAEVRQHAASPLAERLRATG